MTELFAGLPPDFFSPTFGTGLTSLQVLGMQLRGPSQHRPEVAVFEWNVLTPKQWPTEPVRPLRKLAMRTAVIDKLGDYYLYAFQGPDSKDGRKIMRRAGLDPKHFRGGLLEFVYLCNVVATAAAPIIKRGFWEWSQAH